MENEKMIAIGLGVVLLLILVTILSTMEDN